MSASERLRELDAATPLEKYEIDLFSVLPEIVAVVEAAESWRFCPECRYAMGNHPTACSFGRALAALEEKLSA